MHFHLRAFVAPSELSHVVATVCLTTTMPSGSTQLPLNNGFECILHSDAGCMPMQQDSPSVVQHAASEIRCITARRPPVTATCSTHGLPDAISVHSTAVLRDLPNALTFILFIQVCSRTDSPVRSQPIVNDCGSSTFPTETCQCHLLLFNN